MTRFALAQVNPTVGDLKGNMEKMRRFFADAKDRGAEVVVFPSGALSGKPLGGLAEDGDFMARGKVVLEALIGEFGHQAFLKEVFHSAGGPPIEPGIIVRSDAERYYRGKPGEAWRLGRKYAAERKVWLAECNLVGGNDDRIYPGGSFAADPKGGILTAKLFEEDLVVFDTGAPLDQAAAIEQNDIAELYRALVLAIRDYIDKCGLPGAAVSLSGGIDSALVAALAVDALGAERMRFLTLPGPFTSPDTLADAKTLAANLGVPLLEASIVPAYETIRATLCDVLADGPDDPEDLTGQNIQARLRGLYIMALANRQGLLALNCSNKSEAMVGYGTLYGDMIGGFSPLRDVWKTDVWTLSRHANAVADRDRIPQSIIDRIPSAELRQDQEDRQSIPDYPVLDAILSSFVDMALPYSAILKKGSAPADIQKALRLHYTSAFKRQQAPLGPIVTRPIPGKGAPRPIVNRFRPWE